TVTVSPSSATLSAGQAQQFTASVAGSNAGVTWSLSSPSGAVAGTLISYGSNAAVYTAPANVAGNQIIVVKATATTPDNTQSSAQVLQMEATQPDVTWLWDDRLVALDGSAGPSPLGNIYARVATFVVGADAPQYGTQVYQATVHAPIGYLQLMDDNSNLGYIQNSIPEVGSTQSEVLSSSAFPLAAGGFGTYNFSFT